MNQKITSIQAFNAMRKFLENHYYRTLSDDIGSLLSDLQFLQDNETADPAAWPEWMECVNQVLKEKN